MKNTVVNNRLLMLFMVVLGVFHAAYIHAQGFPKGFSDDAVSAMDKAFAETDAEFTALDEYYLGRAAAASILGRYKPYTANPALTAYVNRICQTLSVNSPKAPPFKGYSIVILDSPQYNAFATPGGHIFITKGLLDAATAEDSLAAIIAHEMAHIQLKHGVEVVKEVKFNNSMDEAAQRAQVFSTKTKAANAQRAANLRNTVMPLIDAMLINGYSQTQEFEADKEATAILAASGYDPAALMEILSALQKVQSSQQGGLNSTHPTPLERIANVRNTVQRYKVQNTRLFRTPRFENTVK
jgi:predicted Zn-dependent protease